MATVRVSKKFTVNMGNYESYSPEFSIELEVEPGYSVLETEARAIKLVDLMAWADLSEAAETTNVRDSFILTWLHNRKDDDFGRIN